MRISTSTIYETGSARLSDMQSSLVRQQQQISTGRRMMTPADDPVAAARASEITQSQSANTQFGNNRQNVKDALNQEEGVLTSITSLLQDAKTLVVNAGSGIQSDAERQIMLVDMQGKFDHLLSLANSRDGTGNYMFAGFQTNAQPFSQSATGATYLGDQGQRFLQVANARQMSLNDSGDAAFEGITTGNGTFVTAPAAANAGSGIVSSGSVTNAAALTGDNYSVRFSPSVVANAANTGTLAISSSVASTAALTGSDYRIDYDSTTTNYSITRLSDSVVVYPASAVFPPAAAIDGLNFTAVSGTAPVAGTDSFLVQSQVPAYAIVNTTTSTTLSSGNAYTSGQSIAFDGLQFDVTGTPSNGDQFSVDPSANQSVFTTLRNLINVLSLPGAGATGQARLANGLATANEDISNALDNFSLVRTSVGTRLTELDALDSAGEDKNLQYAQTLSQLQDLDYSKAITELMQQQTTLTAAQQSFVKISGLSLFNYL